MNEELVNAALRDATDTRIVTIVAGALSSVVDVFKQSSGDATAVVVTCENEWKAAEPRSRRRRPWGSSPLFTGSSWEIEKRGRALAR